MKIKKEDKYYYDLRRQYIQGEITIEEICVKDAIGLLNRETCMGDNTNDKLINSCIERINSEQSSYWKNRAILENYAYAITISKRLKWNERKLKIKKASLKVGGTVLIFATVFTGGHAIGKASFAEFMTAFSNSIKQIVKLEFNVKDERESTPIVFLKELPDGYSLVDYRKDDKVGYGILHLSDYKNNNNDIITYQVKIYENYNWNTEIETMGAMSSFEFKGNTYYEASNIDYNILFWYIENRLHMIQGDVPVETLKNILNKNF